MNVIIGEDNLVCRWPTEDIEKMKRFNSKSDAGDLVRFVLNWEKPIVVCIVAIKLHDKPWNSLNRMEFFFENHFPIEIIFDEEKFIQSDSFR